MLIKKCLLKNSSTICSKNKNLALILRGLELTLHRSRALNRAQRKRTPLNHSDLTRKPQNHSERNFLVHCPMSTPVVFTFPADAECGVSASPSPLAILA